MRELTLEEQELISGGSTTDEIVVTADGGGDGGGDWGDWGDWGDYGDYGDYGDGGGGDTGPPPPPPPAADSDSHDVMVNFTRPLTADEQAALTDLQNSITKADTWINNIPDDATLTLQNGDVLTGAQLKSAWANTDFQINEVGTSYQNGTTLGQADYNGGNPLVSYNIDTVNGYNDSTGGTDYLVLHEISHLTSEQRTSYEGYHSDGSYTENERHAHEQMANDIARAVADYNHGTPLTNPGDGYSAGHPTFQMPSPPAGGGSGGSGGGGNPNPRVVLQ
ncbi:hypothetical protein [Novosphingopyxis sp.]|uniref:hypothetical protein n=1 Tax=Novosphingopyxis sp. TaxID=2709690 RepID=UPI003B5C2DE4